jgi:hypothetical protein
MYDHASGTGGMLSVADNYLQEPNPQVEGVKVVTPSGTPHTLIYRLRARKVWHLLERTEV